jgi:GLPGLI family protein
MRQFALSILLAITAGLGSVWAQFTEGVVLYESKTHAHRRLTGDREQFKAMVPEYITTKAELFIKGDETLYKPVIEDDEDPMGNNRGGGGPMRMMMRGAQTEHYHNFDTYMAIAFQEFAGKKYQIEDTLRISPWKFGTETKVILGYTCQQATLRNEEMRSDLVAWYAPALMATFGPESYHSLPGAILEIDFNEGERVITAKKIDIRPLKKNEFKIPSGGQKVTRTEFREMMQEQMRRMGGDGNRSIRFGGN